MSRSFLVRIAVATNEPWGTYHLRPLLPALGSGAPEVVQVVPDLDRVPSGPHVPVVAGPAVDADVLVLTGLTAWPARVAAANPGLPVVASCLAYLNPVPGDLTLTSRVRTVTAASPADAAAFAVHVGAPTPSWWWATRCSTFLPRRCARGTRWC